MASSPLADAAPADLPQRVLVALSAFAASADAAVATDGSASTDVDDVRSEALEVVTSVAAMMKRMLYGIPEAPPDRAVAQQLASAILRSSVLDAMLLRLKDLSFECRRHTTQVFAAIVLSNSAYTIP